MPRGKAGAKKKPKRNTGKPVVKRSLIYKDDMEEYAQMIKMLGDRRIMVMLPDKSEILAIIPRRFRKRCWMKVGDVLLVSRRDYQITKLDVIYKYTDEETRSLSIEHEIPEFFLNSLLSGNRDKNDDDNFLWDDDDNDDDDDDVKLPSQKINYEDINDMISSSEEEDDDTG